MAAIDPETPGVVQGARVAAPKVRACPAARQQGREQAQQADGRRARDRVHCAFLATTERGYLRLTWWIQDKGYEPEALLNYVALLGWHPVAETQHEKGESEIMPLADLISKVRSLASLFTLVYVQTDDSICVHSSRSTASTRTGRRLTRQSWTCSTARTSSSSSPRSTGQQRANCASDCNASSSLLSPMRASPILLSRHFGLSAHLARTCVQS